MIFPTSSGAFTSDAVESIRRKSFNPPVIANPPRPAKSRARSFSANICAAGCENQYLLVKVPHVLQRQPAFFGEHIGLAYQLDGGRNVQVDRKLHTVCCTWSI